MKKTLSILLLMAAAAQAHADGVPSGAWTEAWSHLWRNADQRGAALLQHGDAAAAAQAYADPRGKSYAEFKAGNYAAAAQHLAGLDDSEADYNRGNALAYAGKLQDALNAYDAALKRDPGNRDARHNRDLVAAALKQQQDQKQNEKQDGKQDGNQKQSQGQNGQQQGKNSPQNPNAQPNAKPNAQQNTGQGSGQGGGKNQSNEAKSSAAPTPSNGANAGNPSAAGQTPQQASGQAPAGAAKPGDTEQAGSNGGAGMNAAGDQGKDKPASAQAPQTETQIARDQWLRGIPDDPGGLLRRKFLIEHMIRQQGAQP